MDFSSVTLEGQDMLESTSLSVDEHKNPNVDLNNDFEEIKLLRADTKNPSN
jgi:hypothetical protein